ncbi:MAG TPA: LacI family DNA-binding transcriptional regulator [Ruminiclostridium sp.]
MVFPNENDYKKQLTICDIASKAGVSISTVSRVINDSGLIGKKTTLKVQKIIEEMCYIPNEMARGLLRKASKTVGLIVPDLSNPFFVEFIKSVEEVVSRNGYILSLCNSNLNHDKEKQYIQQLAEKRADGIIFISTFVKNPEIILRLRDQIAIVAVQTEIEGIDCIETTDYLGIIEGVQHLIDLGHKKIGFIYWGPEVKATQNRYKAFEHALIKNGIEVKEEYIIAGGFTGESGYFMTKKLLELPDPPTAIQAGNDSFAFGAYLAIMESGLKIPDDISIVGFDNIMMANISNPPLTTVSQPIYTMGQEAAELLIQNISQGPKEVNKKIVLPTKLIVRGSTAPPKGE